MKHATIHEDIIRCGLLTLATKYIGKAATHVRRGTLGDLIRNSRKANSPSSMRPTGKIGLGQTIKEVQRTHTITGRRCRQERQSLKAI